MATSKGGAKGEKKGKKPHKNKPTSKKFAMYSTSGEKIMRNHKTCPRCGQGNFLAAHSDRLYCGSCHYTEFLGKK